MHLFIIRHGECLGQCEPAYYADPDSPLSSRGEAQVQWVAQQLRAERISRILSSPLLRSLATAHIIADALASCPVNVWLDMREAWRMPYQGVGRSLLLQRFPRANLPSSMTDAGWEHPGDASYEHLFARAKDVLYQIRTSFVPTDRVALVTLGGFANALLHVILQIAPTTPQWFELANGSIGHVRLVPELEKERPNWPLYPPVQVEVLYINRVISAELTVQ
jgi:broad specificity phosphatase PhoE